MAKYPPYSRHEILEKYGYKCARCGMDYLRHIERYGVGLNVDHIEGRNIPDPHNPNNLQALCVSCHIHKDAVRLGRTVELRQMVAECRETIPQS